MHLAPVNQVDSTYLCTHAHYFQRNTINRHSIHRICMESDDWKVCNTWLLGGGIISLISPGSKGTGPHGSCSLQLSRPSSLEMKSAPSLWSVQKELGHSSQKETASFPHTSHWCHGHSHLPAGRLFKTRQSAWYTFGHPDFLQITSCPPSPQRKHSSSWSFTNSDRCLRFLGSICLFFTFFSSVELCIFLGCTPK